jgi:hypothetical protein
MFSFSQASLKENITNSITRAKKGRTLWKKQQSTQVQTRFTGEKETTGDGKRRLAPHKYILPRQLQEISIIPVSSLRNVTHQFSTHTESWFVILFILNQSIHNLKTCIYTFICYSTIRFSFTLLRTENLLRSSVFQCHFSLVNTNEE